MLLIGHDEVVVGGLPGMPPHISLRNLQPNESQIILSTIEETRPSQADIQKVLDQFGSWIKMQSILQIAVGDSVRMTFNKCSIAELSDNLFSFANEAAQITHLISVKDSSSIEVSKVNDETSIVL